MKTILNTLTVLGIVASVSTPAFAGLTGRPYFDEQDRSRYATDAKTFFDSQDNARYATDARTLYDGLTRDGR